MPRPIPFSLSALLFAYYRRWYACLAVAVLGTLMLALWGRTETGQALEARTLDFRFRQFPIAARADTNIVLLAIDQSSLEFFADNDVAWPWPREFYGFVTQYLGQAGARAVLFDILFDEADLERDETSAAETDGAFAQGMEAGGNAVLAMMMGGDATGTDIASFAVDVEAEEGVPHVAYPGVQVPIEILRRAARQLGVVKVDAEADGVLRRVPLLYGYRGQFYPQFAFSALLNDDTRLGVGDEAIIWEGESLPADRQGRYLINWYGPGGVDGVFRHIPFSNVVQSAAASQGGGEPMLQPAYFAGKYVIVGGTAAGLYDFKMTPMGIVPGMEIWATTLSNLLHRDHVVVPPPWVNWLNAGLVCFFVAFIFARFSWRLSTVLVLLILAYLAGTGLGLWAWKRLWINMSLPAVGIVGTYLYIATLSYFAEGRARRQVRQIFDRYVHPEVVERMLRQPGQVEVGGSEVYATVMFSDIGDFTGFAEHKNAAELVTHLNSYFDRLAGIVLDHDGLLDKYTGDGIMALFGVPMTRDDHALLACRTALVQRAYSVQQQQRAGGVLAPADHFHVHTRFGINSGRIVTGNIGSSRRMDYTAIGDGVNLAARLESLNKVYGTQVMLSHDTYQLVADHFLARELDLVQVKGKTVALQVYELVAQRQALEADQALGWMAQYGEALGLYRAGQWQAAMEGFRDLAEGDWADPPARIMQQRCAALLAAPPDHWDGVFVLEEK
ncbi:MAG: CHASE2 domain-containing protein [Candidatus Latescibacteria bacterium]|nr:CHASE2 domain-containing protein [Candidatus Latescibacterota bacterium]